MQRSRSSNALTELYQANEVEMNDDDEIVQDYAKLSASYKRAVPYARKADNTYEKDALCIVCKTNACQQVFYPCKHKCVCDNCIAKHNIGPLERNEANVPVISAISNEKARWAACPLCQSRIVKTIYYTGNEHVKYNDWVYGVAPRLPSGFADTLTGKTATLLKSGNTTQKKYREAQQEPQTYYSNEGCCIIQ